MNGMRPEPPVVITIGTKLKDAERMIVEATLRACGFNQTKAAAALGMHRNVLHGMLVRYAKDKRTASMPAPRLVHGNGPRVTLTP